MNRISTITAAGFLALAGAAAASDAAEHAADPTMEGTASPAQTTPTQPPTNRSVKNN